MSITPKVITVTADNQTRVYGSENPILSVKYSGFKNGDSVIDLLTVPTATTLATSTSDVGTYDIEISNGEATNYMFVYVKGILTVTKESQVITFDTLTFGNEDVFDLVATSSSGLAITYTSSDTSVATISGNTITVLSPGTTAITASQLGNTNYEAAEDVVQELNIASLSTEDKILTLNNVILYPNPAINFIKINLGNIEKAAIKIIDLNGKTIYKNKSYSSEEPLNISYLKTGMYMLNIESNKGNTIKKFIKH